MTIELFLESAFLGSLSLLTMILFITAFKKVFQPNMNFFDRIDKSIILVSGTQILFLTICFLIFACDLFIVIIREARLLQEAVLCMILSFLIFDESKYDIVYKVMTVASSIIALLGLISIFQILFLDDDNLDINFIVFSSLTLFINLVSICFGLKVLFIIQEYFQKELNDSNHDDSDFSEGGKNQIMSMASEEMRNRKMQIYFLVSVHFFSVIVQFIWDIIASACAQDHEEYLLYVEPSGFWTLLLFALLKIATNLAPTWVIYFVFYWRNRFAINEKREENTTELLAEFKRDSLKKYQV